MHLLSIQYHLQLCVVVNCKKVKLYLHFSHWSIEIHIKGHSGLLFKQSQHIKLVCISLTYPHNIVLSNVLIGCFEHFLVNYCGIELWSCEVSVVVNEVLIWLAFGLGQGEAIRTFFTDCIGSTLIAVDLTEIEFPERGFLTVIE